ncbi:MAG: hypothetical protein WBD99_12260 [Thermodesulfobacteriota bacterium]
MDKLIMNSIKLIVTGIFLGIGLVIGARIGKEVINISFPRPYELEKGKKK